MASSSRSLLLKLPSSSSSMYRTTTSCSLLFQFHFIAPFSKTQHQLFSRTACNPNNRTATSSTQEDHLGTVQVASTSLPPLSSNRWRPMCLYHTQGKCSKLDDPTHLERFNHDFSRDLNVDAACFERKRPQEFDHFLVLDLEGKVEILEFPVLLIDAKIMRVSDLFHRFVRPSGMSQQRIDEYIANKYGKFGVDRVWHETAVPFNEVLQQFETWLNQHQLWKKKQGGSLNRAAFVTCGNWDVKTKVPQQCKVSRMKIPQYFMEWINLKDVYKNFYNPEKEARGMRTMMEQLRLPMQGSHHLGIDDTKNIARVLLRMLADGAVMTVTAWRNPHSFEDIRFLYNNRIL